MRFIAEIQLRHPELVLTPTMKRSPGMDVDLEYQLISGSDSYILLFQVRGDDFDGFDAALKQDPTVSDIELLVEQPSFRVYRTRLLTGEYLVLARAVEMGMRLLGATGNNEGWYATLEVPDMAHLQQFRDYCQTKAIEVSIQKLYHTDETEYTDAFGLTPRQRDAIMTAYEAGYFNQPRDTSLQGVADTLGVSSSAASGRLRRGLRALVESTLYDPPITNQ